MLFKNLIPQERSDSLARSTEINNPLDSIVWEGPKRRGLNPEQMSDGINDGLIEREWFDTGKGLRATQ
jgi:hypothetical protein